MTTAGLTPGRSPAVTVPLAYLACAALSFQAAALLVPWLASLLATHYYHPRLMALTHTVALGWITLSVMGASYQFLPVVLERPVWSLRLGGWTLVVLAVGITGMVAHFWIAEWSGLAWAAAVVGLGACLHGLNVGVSLWRPQAGQLRSWPLGRAGFAISLAGLGLTVALGLTLAANRIGGFLVVDPLAAVAAHFHLALLGWVAPVVAVVAARSYPMFLLAPEPVGWPGRVQMWGLGLGAPTLAWGLLAGSRPWTLAGAFAATAALGAHAAWVVGAVRTRRRPSLDWGLRLVLTGSAYLVVTVLVGLGLVTGLLAGPRAALAYGVLALTGWLSLTIAGMMLKIVPFLVWYRAYAGRAGREPVPTLAQLGWPSMERVGYLLLAGAPLILAGAVAGGSVASIRAAGILLAAGATALTACLARVLWHLVTGPASPASARAWT